MTWWLVPWHLHMPYFLKRIPKFQPPIGSQMTIGLPVTQTLCLVNWALSTNCLDKNTPNYRHSLVWSGMGFQSYYQSLPNYQMGPHFTTKPGPWEPLEGVQDKKTFAALWLLFIVENNSCCRLIPNPFRCWWAGASGPIYLNEIRSIPKYWPVYMNIIFIRLSWDENSLLPSFFFFFSAWYGSSF